MLLNETDNSSPIILQCFQALCLAKKTIVRKTAKSVPENELWAGIPASFKYKIHK